jgi:choline dehydrogenase-like flavoprotein
LTAWETDVSAEASSNAARPTDEIVDVLSSTKPTARAVSCGATHCSSPAAPARQTRRSPAWPPVACPGAGTITASYRTLLYHRLQIGVACEDLPEEHDRVTLDSVLRDSHRIPAPKIDYTISENTRRMMEHGIARASEILATAGAKNISASRTVLNSPGHLPGTARMGLDPDRSVVNEWGRCHDVKNLFIVEMAASGLPPAA